MLTQTSSSSVSIKDVVLNTRKKMKKLFRNLIFFFLIIEVAGQNVLPDTIDKDQDDLVFDSNDIQTSLRAEDSGESKEHKDQDDLIVDDAERTQIPSQPQCCGMVELRMAGSPSTNQPSRLGRYRQRTPTNYDQVGGTNHLYKWRDTAWYFGVDFHTSGVQSEPSTECPDMVEQWRFWSSSRGQEEWSGFQNNEIWVTCVDEDQIGPNLSENSVLVMEDEDSLANIHYSTHDGPNVQCSNLDKSAPGYPPHPRIVLLGASGVGKSSLGNQLLGCYRKEKDCAFFSVGHGSSSHTTETFWAVGNYMGKGGCVTLVDTPGASDSEGRDYKHALDMANVLKTELKSVDVFLLMFNGQNPRFLASITKLLKLYESIFSEDIWKHAITEITYWKWDTDSVEDRLYDTHINATLKHLQWNQKYREKLGVTIGQVPTVFVDPVFPMFSKNKRNQRKLRNQPEAIEKFVFHTSLLWRLATVMPEFHCKERCTAPQGYFTGTPWVTQPIIKGRLGATQTSSCQIWKGIVDQSSTENVKWKINGTTIFEKKTDESSDISSTNINPDWSDKIKVEEIENEHFSEFQLTIKNLSLDTQGKYSCENDVESTNNEVEMLLIVDGSWSSWGSWSRCSIICLKDGGDPGISTRSRECILPRNGGKDCISSDSKEQRSCAGDDLNFKFCPIDHSWSDWSEWTSCSKKCGNGTIWRSRQCQEGRHGGTVCPQTATLEETQLCHLKPCPDCNLQNWSAWSTCTVGCLNTMNKYGTKTRTRKSDEADPEQPVCDPDDLTETRPCAGDNDFGVTNCPIDAKWTAWSEYGQCSATCGEGKHTRVRTCTEQTHGGEPCDKLDGDGQEVSTCSASSGSCPEDCEVSVWATWGECSHNCGTGTKKRTRTVVKQSNYGGKDCEHLEKTDFCYTRVCPPCENYLNSWTEWTSCSGGMKTETRSRSIDFAKQKLEFTGIDCSKVEDRTETKECPVDCEWKQWTSWTYMECSSICYNGITDVWATGTQQSYRRRTILRYQSGGGVCKGQNFQQQSSACKKQCNHDFTGQFRAYTKTSWGSWGAAEECPFPYYVNSVDLKIEGKQGSGDDTALNTIDLRCKDTTSSSTKTIRSKGGYWGSWRGWTTCNSGYMKGVQLRSESKQGDGDDTAVNGLRFICTDGGWKYPGDGYWGSWSDTKYCPSGSAVYRIQTQVEGKQGDGDDTALNDANFYCAKLV